jgi:hypothetical protein
MMETTVLFDIFNTINIPRYVPQHNSIAEIYRKFLGLHGVASALTCTVISFFLNHVQTIEMATGGLQVVGTSQG